MAMSGDPGRALDGTVRDMRAVEALYEDGLLRPKRPLALRTGEQVSVIVLRRTDPKRWNLGLLGRAGQDEDLALSKQGLAQWSETLEGEDRG
jgi:predicted DNA-binding antitoxin AbrB/MazE fold protein